MAFSFFDRVKAGLEKTKNNFVKKVETIVIGYAEIDDDFLDDLYEDELYEEISKLKFCL